MGEQHNSTSANLRIKAAFADALSGQRGKRHPCEVTSDRLADHSERYADQMSGEERDALAVVRDVLERIAGNHDD